MSDTNFLNVKPYYAFELEKRNKKNVFIKKEKRIDF